MQGSIEGDAYRCQVFVEGRLERSRSGIATRGDATARVICHINPTVCSAASNMAASSTPFPKYSSKNASLVNIKLARGSVTGGAAGIVSQPSFAKREQKRWHYLEVEC